MENRAISTSILICILFCETLTATAQDCTVRNRVLPDGRMVYFIEMQALLRSGSKELDGAVTTDGDFYYLQLRPKPIIPKDKLTKSARRLQLILSNDSVYVQELLDTQYLQDTAVLLTYRIASDQIEPILKYELRSAVLDMGEQQPRAYDLTQHGWVIRDQLQCVLKVTRKRTFNLP